MNNYPMGFNEDETMVTVNQRMVGKLIEYQNVEVSITEQAEMEAIGSLIRKVREGLGIPMYELGRRSNIDASFIPLIEGGNALPKDITLQVMGAIASALIGNTFETAPLL